MRSAKRRSRWCRVLVALAGSPWVETKATTPRASCRRFGPGASPRTNLRPSILPPPPIYGVFSGLYLTIRSTEVRYLAQQVEPERCSQADGSSGKTMPLRAVPQSRQRAFTGKPSAFDQFRPLELTRFRGHPQTWGGWHDARRSTGSRWYTPGRIGGDYTLWPYVEQERLGRIDPPFKLDGLR